MIYPPAWRQPIVDDLHGNLVPDPYRWLENPSGADTTAWLAAQDDLWRDHATGLPGRHLLHMRVAELSDAGEVMAPKWRGGRRFHLRQGPGQEHAVLYTVGADGAEDVLVDPMALDATGSTTLDAWQPDPDGRLLAYQISRHGDERSELYVLDVETGRVVDGPLDRCRYSPVAWLPGGSAFYYVRTTDGGRRVFLHTVGVASDVLVFGAGRDATTAFGLDISQDGRWLTVAATRGAAPGNDLWLADLAASPPGSPALRVVQEGVDARTAATVGRDGRMYVLTDLGAPRKRLCVGDPGGGEWVDLVPEDATAVLKDVVVLDGPDLARPLLLVGRTRHALSEIGIYDLVSGAPIGEVPLPGLGSVGSLSVRPSGGHEVWFSYMDSVTPGAVYRFDALTGETTLWAAAPGAAQVPVVESRQIVCTSADGTPVRVIVFARPGGGAGPRPTILYGYGGFGFSLTPAYSSYLLAWVEAGGVFATAQLRGGGEEGERWHRDGMLDRKQNVFDDFVAVAERLITDGWTTPTQLGICGESNGGLLVGAAITQRPDLFAAAVCSAPVLDMARYELSGLGANWRGEYGSAADPKQLRWLLGYSPYHRVRLRVDYPAVLLTSFGGDSRVDPLHARKMCAALQWATGGDRPVLLRHEDGVGHGKSATSRGVALAADMLAFLGAHTGLDFESRQLVHASRDGAPS
ncbi:MAG TPA: prolyl oligopeptidase family serine peptidase [Pseudonocardiaceae bacterium]|nr:prolyl oligopeptidase family serine peptidase [Pseudonocardiaceae bacterium]